MSLPRERIAYAAIRYEGDIYLGERHAIVMAHIRKDNPEAYITQDMQGYVTDTDRFVSRVDAAWIAFLAGQTTALKGTLLSEHLW